MSKLMRTHGKTIKIKTAARCKIAQCDNGSQVLYCAYLQLVYTALNLLMVKHMKQTLMRHLVSAAIERMKTEKCNLTALDFQFHK